VTFYGTYEYQLDDRNRVALPPAFRDAYDAGAVLATGVEPCVLVYTPSGFEKAGAAIEAIPIETEDGREARRDFYGNAFPEKKDAQGRILLRGMLITHAGLRKDVLVIGAGDCLEIWDRPTYEARAAEREAARRNRLAQIGERKAAQQGTGA
jgi:MraZ protein